jgi:hypothetical protein
MWKSSGTILPSWDKKEEQLSITHAWQNLGGRWQLDKINKIQTSPLLDKICS